MPDDPKLTRRRLLATAAAFAGLPLAVAWPRPRHGFHLVDGWILTTRDLQALGLDDL